MSQNDEVGYLNTDTGTWHRSRECAGGRVIKLHTRPAYQNSHDLCGVCSGNAGTKNEVRA